MTAHWRKLLLWLALFAMVAGCVWLTGLHQHVSLAELKQAQVAFASHYAAQPVQTTLLYFACFTLVTACCLPGAALLMLVAGASFGLVWGSAVAVVASAVGATLTLMTSRHLLRKPVEARYSRLLSDLNNGLARGRGAGALYLLSLRLLPIIPFVPLNLLCGVTRLPLRVFFTTSLVGMLPATMVYVNAGVQLSALESISDVFSPGLVTALVLLGLLPLVTQAALRAALRQKKI